MKKRNITLFTAFAAAAAFASSAQAATIISGETATASSDFFGGESWGRPVEALVNDVGMTGEGATGLHANTNYEHGWQNGQATAPWIKVDLGATVAVGKMYVWNGASSNKDWGAQTVDIYYATTDPGVNVNDSEAAFNPAGWTLWSSGVTFAKHAGSGSYLPTDDFDLNVTARYIALNVTVAYGGINNASIAELQFEVVPEPATMSLLALGGLALLRRRRA